MSDSEWSGRVVKSSTGMLHVEPSTPSLLAMGDPNAISYSLCNLVADPEPAFEEDIEDGEWCSRCVERWEAAKGRTPAEELEALS